MSKHKCIDCTHYRPYQYLNGGACTYTEINPHNHEVSIYGKTSWNKKGTCKKFEPIPVHKNIEKKWYEFWRE